MALDEGKEVVVKCHSCFCSSHNVLFRIVFILFASHHPEHHPVESVDLDSPRKDSLVTFFSFFLFIDCVLSRSLCILYKKMNALLDYGSSSNDSEDDSSQEAPKESTKPKLPKPSLGENALHCSVFSNPFVEAELAKSAILEKHVKMVPGKEGTQMINGKKICWNYRKGRCRFGHNCKYAHDSDIQKSKDEIEVEKKKLKTVVCESAGSVLSAPPPTEEETISSTDDSQWENSGPMKKKRPGLSQNLVPGKKVMNIYKKLKLKDSNKAQ